jgi:hypothetical protein
MNSTKYAGFLGEEMDKWKLVYRSSANNAKKCGAAKCGIIDLKDSDSDADSGGEDERSHTTGPQKCMVALDMDMDMEIEIEEDQDPLTK